MPLTRLKDEYLEQNGVRFLMEDQDGSTVACRVSHEALRDHADRVPRHSRGARAGDAQRLSRTQTSYALLGGSALWRWRPSRRGQQPNADLDAPPNVRYWG